METGHVGSDRNTKQYWSAKSNSPSTEDIEGTTADDDQWRMMVYILINCKSGDKDETSSSRSNLSKQSSLEKYGQESASEVTDEQNDNEFGITSFTDDKEDDYTHSSYPDHKWKNID